jgi:hypothetical protein
MGGDVLYNWYLSKKSYQGEELENMFEYNFLSGYMP